MIGNKLHTPEGVRDILWNEYKEKLVIIDSINNVFGGSGFEPIQTPTFEYYEVYSDERGSMKPENMYKFFDREGNILVLRPDLTPAIARVVGGIPDDEFPLKVYTIGNTYRYNSNFTGKASEITQASAEYIGDGSVEADAEMIAMSIRTLLNCGLKEFQIDIGEVNFFKGILEEANLSKDFQDQISGLIDDKNYFAVEELLQSTTMDNELKNLLLELPNLFGSVEILKRALNFTRNEKAISSVNRLMKIYEIIKGFGLEKYVAFDLSMIRRLNYYTGIIFRGYTYGTGVSILVGGRYDNLQHQFGKERPAVGFAVIVDELQNSIIRQKISIKTPSVDVLIVYTTETICEAYKMSNEYREKGLRVTTLLKCKEDGVYNKYAAKKNIEKVIFV